jgi:peptidoglycan/xylan/chitin deacetylase (PgdA/CDA1 family)
MPSKKRKGNPKRALVIAIVLFVAFYLVWHFDKYRKIPIEHAVNPVWWIRHEEGNDLYDPDSGMLYQGNPKLKEIALTIDDGPNPLYGPAIIETLHQYNVPATFFVVGTKAREYPNILRMMAKDGDEIGNHTYDHQRLPALKPHEIASEIRDDDADIFRATGIHTRLLRPPGMEYNNKVLTVSKALGYRTISYTEAAKDFLPQTPSFISQRIINRVENGSIILLHQDTPDTVQALPAIITGLRAQGYQFVTIKTMLEHLNAPPLDNKPPKSKLWDIGPGTE